MGNPPSHYLGPRTYSFHHRIQKISYHVGLAPCGSVNAYFSKRE